MGTFTLMFYPLTKSTHWTPSVKAMKYTKGTYEGGTTRVRVVETIRRVLRVE